MKIALILIALCAAISAQVVSYEGYTTYKITATNEDEASVLYELYETGIYDFWTPVRALNYPVTVMVPPNLKQTFTATLNNKNIQYSVAIENVETILQVERASQARAARAASGRISFDAYYRYDAILEYLDQLGSDYSEIVSVEDYGTSYEGRPLRLIRIGVDASNPTILIEGGMHAREWIAPAVVLYTIQQLVENTENRGLIENANWIIIPVSNPDGYEFSHTNNRMWRKTRRIGNICNGVDGNRNFDYIWGGLGTSTSECTEIFIGPYPFSESECLSLAEVALQTENIVLYLAVHSFGNWILYPWGYTLDPADNEAELDAVGQAAANAIETVDGTRYVVGNSAGLLYFAAGASDDWMKGVANIPLSYTIELPGDDDGFVLPPERIQPVATETWQGILSFYNSAVTTRK